MKRRGKIQSLILACVLCVSALSAPVKADELSQAKEKQEELEAKQKEAEKEQKELADRLEKVAAELEETQEKLDAKKLELVEIQDQLDFARIEERRQYEDMKLRIKFMYENGDTQILEMLLESESIGDFLNKAEYIQQVSEYDREQLEAFQDTVKQIEETEAKLKEEEAKLTEMQEELTARESEVEGLLAEAGEKLSGITEELGETTKKIERIIKEAEEEAKKNQSSKPQGGGKPGDSQIIGNGALAWPTSSRRITSYYGNRVAPVPGATSWHDAIDIGAPSGSPVYAAADGTVITAKWGYNGGRGVYVMIDHHNGLVTRYQHLSDMYVSVGEKVSKGQNIAAVGNTGASSGPHLDFAIYANGRTVDPLTYY